MLKDLVGLKILLIELDFNERIKIKTLTEKKTKAFVVSNCCYFKKR